MKNTTSQKNHKINNFTIPNILSAYRLLMFPVVLYFALNGMERYFALFLIINLITDGLDGFIARNFNQETALGAKLDSIADFGTYILAITGIVVFKGVEMQEVLPSFIVFGLLFLATHLFALYKFKRMPSLHLYSWKIGGYIQAAFFTYLFSYGFSEHLYWVMWTWGILAFIEHILVQIQLEEMIANAKGLYWVLKR